jgi:TetR/AcrR family transcriptional regulator
VLAGGCALAEGMPPPDPKPRPRGQRAPIQPRAEETRARILQKARDAFAELGFDGANIRDIAREAGVTHSMVTYHFGTKDRLWREAVRDMFALIETWLFAPGFDDPALGDLERYRLMLRRYTHYCAQHPEHARITILESLRGGERLQWMIDEFVTRNHAPLRPLIETLIRSGDLPAVRFESLHYAIVGMAQLPFLLAREAQAIFGYDFTTPEAIERHADTILALLFRDGRGAAGGG